MMTILTNNSPALIPLLLLATALSIPLISIIDITVEACRGHASVGVLATAGCLEAGLYQDALAAAGIVPVLPEADEVAEISRLAIEIKLGERGPEIRARMQAVAAVLVARGARALVAACTEIPLVLQPDMLTVPLISSTDELAKATADRCGAVA